MDIDKKVSNTGEPNTKNKNKYQQLKISGSIKIGVYTFIFKHKSKTSNDNKVKNILYNIRNSIFPKNINNIKIIFDDKIPNSQNLPFCLNNTKFFNQKKQN